MLRATVSQIEQFRRYRNDEDYPTGRFLAYLQDILLPTPQQLVGIAFHEALEHIDYGAHEEISARGFTFRFSTDFVLPIQYLREARCERVYDTSAGKIEIRGRVDAIEPMVIYDHKTTSNFDPERYLDGYEWRYYLDLTASKKFVWNVFELSPTKKPDVFEVPRAHVLTQFTYPGISRDCGALADEFASFLKTQKINL